MLSYSVTLSDALTPITLISGVGLLLLAMTARYNYTTDRVRALLKERRQKAPVIDPVLEKAIRLTYERLHCRLYHFLCAGSPNFSEDHPHLHSRRERLIVVQFR